MKTKRRKMKTKKIFKTILNISSYVLIFFLFSMLAFVIISNFSGKIAFIGGRSLMWVKTGSMDPTIEERSYIVVKRSDGSDIEIGDVITFKSPDPLLKGAYNTHRVVLKGLLRKKKERLTLMLNVSIVYQQLMTNMSSILPQHMMFQWV